MFKTASVIDSRMSFVEQGSGRPVLFLHGNPTSSYLWRNVLLVIAHGGFRAIAVDLIGMGQSGTSSRGYQLTDHIAYVDAFVHALDLHDLVLVGHDWGGAIALALARRHPGRVAGVAILETHLHPIDSWSDMTVADRDMFSQLRADGTGERLVLDENFFIEIVLPSGIARELTPEEHDRYRQPFPDASSRVPILEWVRQIPIEGQPHDVAALILQNQDVLMDATLPTLLYAATPGRSSAKPRERGARCTVER